MYKLLTSDYFYAIIAAKSNKETMPKEKHAPPPIMLRNIPADVLERVKEMQYAILKSHPTRTKVGLAEAIYKLIRNSKA